MSSSTIRPGTQGLYVEPVTWWSNAQPARPAAADLRWRLCVLHRERELAGRPITAQERARRNARCLAVHRSEGAGHNARTGPAGSLVDCAGREDLRWRGGVRSVAAVPRWSLWPSWGGDVPARRPPTSRCHLPLDREKSAPSAWRVAGLCAAASRL